MPTAATPNTKHHHHQQQQQSNSNNKIVTKAPGTHALLCSYLNISVVQSCRPPSLGP